MVRFEVQPLKFGSTQVRHLKVRFGSSSKKGGSNASLTQMITKIKKPNLNLKRKSLAERHWADPHHEADPVQLLHPSDLLPLQVGVVREGRPLRGVRVGILHPGRPAEQQRAEVPVH